MFEVWQNLAPFGSRPIGGAIVALLTKVVNSLTAKSVLVGEKLVATSSIST
jgi:hypothetical protein